MTKTRKTPPRGHFQPGELTHYINDGWYLILNVQEIRDDDRGFYKVFFFGNEEYPPGIEKVPLYHATCNKRQRLP